MKKMNLGIKQINENSAMGRRRVQVKFISLSYRIRGSLARAQI